jgi:hypothetical protein
MQTEIMAATQQLVVLSQLMAVVVVTGAAFPVTVLAAVAAVNLVLAAQPLALMVAVV